MQSAILKKKCKIEICEFKIPNNLRSDQVLIKTKFSSICGSQLMEYLGKRGKDKFLPHAFGHEAVGKVLKIGNAVKKVKKGDDVILSWIKGIGKDKGGYQLINNKKEKINFGPISTFSSHIITTENRVFRKPKKMNLIEASFYGCAVQTGTGIVLNQMKKLKKNSKVCLIGIGGIGMATLLALKKKNCKISIIEKNKSRIESIKRIKLTILSEKNRFKKLMGSFDYCIDTSGSTKMIELGLDLIKNHGTLIFASHPPHNSKIKIDPHDLIKGKKIFGSWGGSCKPDKDITKIFNYFNKKNLYSANIKFKIYSINNIYKAIDDMITGKVQRSVLKF